MAGGVNMDKAKAIAVGFSCVDVYEELNRFYPTGNGINWAIHLSRLGVSASAVTVVGTDQYGRAMKEKLAAEGIDISHLHQRDGDTCKMIMALNGNDRVHLKQIEGVMAYFSLTNEDMEFIGRHDYIHLDLFCKVLDKLPEFKQMGLKVVMDFSTYFDNPAYNADDYFKYVDYAFFSYKAHDAYIEDKIKAALSMGTKAVVATLGENGSVAWDGKDLYICPAYPVNEIVNTVGAGDAYIAGFTDGVINGYDIQMCMETGARLSAEVISKFEPY